MRYGVNLHFPSDLKEIQVNKKFSLNLKEIPKPIKYRIVSVKNESKNKESKKECKKDEVKKEPKAESDSSKPTETKAEANGSDVSVKSETPVEAAPIKTEVVDEKEAKPDKEKDKESKSKQPKVSVKVILLSLPSMAEIYDRVLGTENEQ